MKIVILLVPFALFASFNSNTAVFKTFSNYELEKEGQTRLYIQKATKARRAIYHKIKKAHTLEKKRGA